MSATERLVHTQMHTGLPPPSSTAKDRPIKDDDSDAEMADYGTDSSDDVDPNFDACQGTSTTRTHCRNTLTPIA